MCGRVSDWHRWRLGPGQELDDLLDEDEEYDF